MTHRRIVVTKHNALGSSAVPSHPRKETHKHKLRQIINANADHTEKNTVVDKPRSAKVTESVVSKSLHDVRKRGGKQDRGKRRRSVGMDASLPDSLRRVTLKSGSTVNVHGTNTPKSTNAVKYTKSEINKEKRAVTDVTSKVVGDVSSYFRKPRGKRRSKTARNRRQRNGISFIIPSGKNRARTRRRYMHIQRKIRDMNYETLHHFLVKKNLIKPSSTAPEAILRQIASSMFFN